MPWSRFDDGFYDHPKTVEAGDEAVGLFVRLVTYSNKNLLDGRVTDQDIRKLVGDPRRASRLKERLICVGFLTKSRGGPKGTNGRYLIHDYLHYNDSAEDIKARRAAEREKKRKQRSAANAQSPEGSPPGTGVHKGNVSPGESRPPDPTRPDPGSGVGVTNPVVGFGPAGDRDAPPGSPGSNGGVSHENRGEPPEATPEQHALLLLLREGKTPDGARETVEALGAEAVIAKFSRSEP